MRAWLQLGAVGVLCALAIAIFFAWRADRRQRIQLQTELAAAQKTVATLTAKQQDRDLQLAQALKQLAQEKRSVKTPAAALRQLPRVLPLPVTIQEAALALTPAVVPARNPARAVPLSTRPPKTVALPAEDLKPLYDFAVDCRACDAKLAASQADLADEKAKTEAVSRERDDALRAARGGSIWRRIGRAAKWFALGAAAGALAAKAGH